MASLRKIYESDLEKIMLWRMSPDITKWMNTNPKLTLESQKIWFEKINNNVHCKYWLIEEDKIPIGVINLENINFDKKECEWAYYIGEKKKRSFILALNLEFSLYSYVFDVLKLEKLISNVLSINDAVIEMHKRCGSKIIKTAKNKIFKEGKYYDSVLMEITVKDWEQIKNEISYEKIDFNI